jgi:hypothetical protein
VLNGDYSHIRSNDAIKNGQENRVAIVFLPPHRSHKKQPLDVAFMGPFKTDYAQESERWSNPGHVVTAYQIGELFGRTYIKAAAVEAVMNGSREA